MNNFIDSLFIFGAKYLYLIILAIALFYFLKQSKKRKKQIIVFSAVVLPLVYITAKLASFFFYDPRPFAVENFTPLIPHAPDNGFPSDHTLLSAAIAFLFYFFNKKIGIILFVLTLAVGLSRVYVGVHHLIDVVGSIIIAAIVAFLVFRLIKRTKYYTL